jgi:hypothetical protein
MAMMNYIIQDAFRYRERSRRLICLAGVDFLHLDFGSIWKPQATRLKTRDFNVVIGEVGTIIRKHCENRIFNWRFEYFFIVLLNWVFVKLNHPGTNGPGVVDNRASCKFFNFLTVPPCRFLCPLGYRRPQHSPP